MDKLKIYLHYIIHILLAACILLLLLLRPCVNVQLPTQVQESVKLDTVVIDSIVYVSVEIPKPVTKLVTVYDTIVSQEIVYVDTSEYRANYYEDSIEVETGKIRWYAATTGLLLALDAEYEGRIKKVIEYKEKETVKYKTGLYVTSGIGYNFADNATADIGLSLITKKGRIYGYEYDFLNNFHKIKTGLRLF